MNKYLLIPLVLFIGLFAFLLVGLNRDPRELPSPLINKTAPDFQLGQLKDPAKTVTAKEMRGKVWLLNFWGTWCVACRDEHPILVKYSKTNALPIYGVDYKDDRKTALEMLEEEGNPYTVIAFDPEGRTSIDYGVYGAPESYLIDKKGVIRFKQIGPITDDVWNKKILPLASQLNNE
jgi:cytochrome c biogenesis protein CcmG/thiol:disulfide interchange protein DsbE